MPSFNELTPGHTTEVSSPRFNNTTNNSPLARHKETDNIFNMIDVAHMGVPSTNSTKNKNGKIITLKAKSSLEFYSLKSKATLMN